MPIHNQDPILYNDYVSNSDELIENIQSYVISQDMIEKFTQENRDEKYFFDTRKNSRQTSQKKEVQKTEPKPSSESKVIYAREKDTLFWCFYIMKNGVDDYLFMPHRNMVIEKKLKIELIEKLRENKTFIKVNKLGPLTHIENFLLNETTIDMKTFNALCCFENLSCILSFPNFFCEVNIDTNDDDPNTNIMMLIKNEESGKFGFKQNVKQEEVNLVRTTKYRIDNLAKPIKAMTAYKMEELINIAEKLNIEIPEKSRKKDIYELIVQLLSS